MKQLLPSYHCVDKAQNTNCLSGKQVLIKTLIKTCALLTPNQLSKHTTWLFFQS